MRTKSNPGIVERHSRSCASKTGGACNCVPSYMAWTWDRRTGKKVYKTFSGRGAKSAAKGWRSDAVGQVRRGTLKPPTRKTLRDAWADFTAAVERGEVLSRYRRPYAPSALRTYKSDFDRFIDSDLGALRIEDIRRGDVQRFVDRLNGLGLSGSRVRGIVTPLQALYRWADRRDMVTIDPTVNLELPALAGRRERVVTPAEAAALIAALPEEDKAIWATAFYAGLRRGELRALRVSSLLGPEDFTTDAITAIRVEHGWDDVEGERETKSLAGVREVPVPTVLDDLLRPHLEHAIRFDDWEERLVFGREDIYGDDLPFTPTHIRKRAITAWASTGLQGCTLHEARHSYSTYLDAAGISETRADRYMGHSNPTVANRYRHQLEGQLSEDARCLDEYLRGTAAGKVVPIATGARTGAQAAHAG